MTKILTYLTSFGRKSRKSESDFSDFFGMSAGAKKKVINQVLREANAEQRKVVTEYRKRQTATGS